MSAFAPMVKIAGRLPKARRARWPGGRDPERYRRYMRKYMRAYRRRDGRCS